MTKQIKMLLNKIDRIVKKNDLVYFYNNYELVKPIRKEIKFNLFPDNPDYFELHVLENIIQKTKQEAKLLHKSNIFIRRDLGWIFIVISYEEKTTEIRDRLYNLYFDLVEISNKKKEEELKTYKELKMKYDKQ